ncbi:MAG: site-specific integrase [Nitrosopumilus sp.]|nr:site-specific integrase [Nitrosopumilus sp.]
MRVPKIVRTHEKPLDKELLNRVLRNVSPKLQVVILVTTSSGLRIGELVQIKTSDIDFTSNPTKILVRGSTTKGKIARETFITQEATIALKDYLKSNFSWIENKPEFDVYIFGKTTNKGKKPKNSGHNPYAAKMALQASPLYYLRKVPALQTKNENGYYSIHFHAFRKFCRTTIGNVCGRDFAEALLGHAFYMDTYYQLSENQKRDLYLKAESRLTITKTDGSPE